MLSNSGDSATIEIWDGDKSNGPTRFEVMVSEQNPFCPKGEELKYVKIHSGKTEVLRVCIRRGAQSTVMLVSANSGLKVDQRASVFPASKFQFNMFRLVHDKQQRLALIGFILGALGLIAKFLGEMTTKGDPLSFRLGVAAVSLQTLGLLFVLAEKISKE